MLKINKIQDKEEIMVLSQYNCKIRGRDEIYMGKNDDCMDDCERKDKPLWFQSQAC
ncbi:hypothetical protein NSA24_07510 [Clostridioides mangenotii]|uniref:hypothetical protein n=1 Tax=Metaclostridioides mangenotii TaxID=1540 RepID=UPI002149B39A|nr:hypothetical protein [Clostridioides mangenotii]MCR1954638.1 hypothetical protein [Clostridioides mangenotii]